MDNLWAPWRMAYIKNIKIKSCIFCRALKKKQGPNNYVVLRSKYSFIIMNVFPYNNGHLMIVPNRHVADFSLLNDNELLDLNKNTKKAIDLLKKILKPDGFNIGINIGKASGAGIDKHIHVHVVPRWQGDTNFMMACANTKVIPQSLNGLYQKLIKQSHEKI